MSLKIPPKKFDGELGIEPRISDWLQMLYLMLVSNYMRDTRLYIQVIATFLLIFSYSPNAPELRFERRTFTLTE